LAAIGVSGLRKVLSLPNADATGAVWSPDGSWLAFTRNGRDSDDGVYIQRADGTGASRAVVKIRTMDEATGVVDWARDGLLTVRALGAKREIFLTPVSASGEPGEPKLLLAPSDLQSGAVLSPDGSLLAYVSDDSGRTEISVVEVASGVVRGAPVVVTSGGGFEPTWSKDGKRLYFRQPPGRVMFMNIERTAGIRASAPVLLLDLKSAGMDVNTWDILPDGRLVAIKLGEGEGDVTSYSVILNWLDSVRGKLNR
jgi:Tol biopolymer transport system component